MFDASDKDTSRSGLAKRNTSHADAVAAAAYLQQNYPDTSYILLNHPSRKLMFSAADIRDLNNAAPNVCFGMEGMPGHQNRNGNPLNDDLAKNLGLDNSAEAYADLWFYSNPIFVSVEK